MTRIPFAVMISGRGSNMISILDAARTDDFPGKCVLVLSNTPTAPGLISAADRGIATACIDHRPFGKDRESFERCVDAELRKSDAEFVALAGFMRVLTPWFVARWSGRLINIHPSLLPKYKGLNTHARAIEAGDEDGGCSVHYVTEGVDEGDVIAQTRVPILQGDTPDKLAARVLIEEHTLYPRALAKALRVIRTPRAS